MAIEIGTAYLNVVPSFKGFRNEVEKAMGSVGGAGSQSAGQQSGESFLGGFKGKLVGGVAAVGVAAAAVFADAYGEALQSRNAKVLAQAQLGISPKESERLGKIAGQLYRQNYGESISGLTGDVATVFSSLKGLGSDKEIERATAKALSFGQAFEVDVSDAVQSVSTLVGSGLVKDSNEAFDLLTASAQKVPAALRENVFEASDEYSQFFRTLGFSGDEAFGALVKGAEKGEFGIDKTGDAIKEFTLLSTDMSENTVGAYESIGLNATEMTNAILAGGDTSKEAFNKITDGILGIQDPAAQSQAALALFGTPLEDMNVQDIPEFLQGLKGMSGGMGDTAGAADKMDAALGSTTSGVETFWRGLKANLVDFIEQKVLPAVTMVAQWLGEKLTPAFQVAGEWIQNTLVPAIQNLIVWLGENLGPVIEKVGAFFTEVLVPATIQAAAWFNETLLPVIQRVGQMFADTFGNILQILGGFIDFLIGVFTGNWSKAWDGIKQIFGGIWDQIKNIVSLVWDTIQALLKAGWDWVKVHVVDAIAADLAAVGGFFSGLWMKVQEVWGWILDKLNTAWAWIRDFVFAPLKSGLDEVGLFFSNLWGTVQNVWTWIQTKIGEVWDWINANVFAPLILGINTIMTWMANLWTKVEEVWGKISGFFADVAQGIKDAVATVKQAIKDIGDEIQRFLTERVRNWGGTDSGGVLGNIQLGPGGARGMVVPGRDPGRRDNMLMPVRSEEAIMVPEFTHQMGGAAGIYTLNRLAEAGRLHELFGGGLARGGVVGQKVHDTIVEPVKALLQRIKTQVMTSGGVSEYGPENYSGNAINTQAAIDFIKRVFGLTDVYGWRASGSVAGSDHPKGKAIDAMIPNYRSDAGIALGTRLADWFIQNPRNFGTKYVIWRDRINQGGSWAPYSHPGGNNDTLAHRDHVHISLLTGAVAAAGRAVGESLGGGGGNVERWRGMAMSVLQQVGAYRGMNLTPFIGHMLNQIRTESGGNPNAINNWDSNARRGDPSIGLLQVIGSTFRNALSGTPFAYLIGAGQRNPMASMVASTLYSLNRYGSLDRAWRGVAYDNGGMWQPGTMGVNLLNRPEAVLTPSETNAYQAHARALEDGFAGRTPGYTFTGDIHVSDPAEFFRETAWQARKARV